MNMQIVQNIGKQPRLYIVFLRLHRNIFTNFLCLFLLYAGIVVVGCN